MNEKVQYAISKEMRRVEPHKVFHEEIGPFDSAELLIEHLKKIYYEKKKEMHASFFAASFSTYAYLGDLAYELHFLQIYMHDVTMHPEEYEIATPCLNCGHREKKENNA